MANSTPPVVIDLTASDNECDDNASSDQGILPSLHGTKRRLPYQNDEIKPKAKRPNTATDAHERYKQAAPTSAINSISTPQFQLRFERGTQCHITSNINLPTSRNNTLTCMASTSITAQSSLQNNSSGYLTHIQQKDKWSCGFRNLQMVLSVILQHMDVLHPFRTNTAMGVNCANSNPSLAATTCLVPCIRKIQASIEEAWDQGFDETGSEFFKGALQGKKSKIGAVEASSLLSFWQVDSTVVQFITCYESRRLLGKFVWNYFEAANRERNCEIGAACGSEILVENLIELVEGPSGCMSSSTSATRTNYPQIAPLYLQWEGHSVTIVGIERNRNQNEDEFNLLVFDPMKKWNGLPKNDAWLGKRLSTSTTMKKDCQLIVVSSRILSAEERELRRKDEASGVVTAAKQKVCQAIEARF